MASEATTLRVGDRDVRISSPSRVLWPDLGVTKLDVLDGMDSVRLAVGYRVNNARTDILPAGADALEACEPIYEELPGWKESTVGLTRYAALPKAARNYLKRIERIGRAGRRMARQREEQARAEQAEGKVPAQV